MRKQIAVDSRVAMLITWELEEEELGGQRSDCMIVWNTM
jgi:hypothetical protein